MPVPASGLGIVPWAVPGSCGAGKGSFSLVMADFSCPGWWQEGLSAMHASLLTAQHSALFLIPVLLGTIPLPSAVSVLWNGAVGLEPAIGVSPDVPTGCHMLLHSDSSSPWGCHHPEVALCPLAAGGDGICAGSGTWTPCAHGLGKLLSLLCWRSGLSHPGGSSWQGCGWTLPVLEAGLLPSPWSGIMGAWGGKGP